MIFRALFWIGLVSLLAPHEPDLGLGHPGAGTLQPSSAGLSRTSRNCGSPCAGGLGIMERIHFDTSVTARLADVKAQIEADRQARRLRTQAS